jgi:hypothetical protein
MQFLLDALTCVFVSSRSYNLQYIDSEFAALFLKTLHFSEDDCLYSFEVVLLHEISSDLTQCCHASVMCNIVPVPSVQGLQCAI